MFKKLVHTYNIQEDYLDQDDPWMLIRSVTSVVVRSTVHTLKGYTMAKLVFGRNVILPIKHIVNSKLLRHHKQTQITYNNAHKNKVG